MHAQEKTKQTAVSRVWERDEGMADGHVQGTNSASYKSVPLTERPPGLRCRDVITFALCWVVYIFGTAVFSLLGPFFPIEAGDKGASSTMVGAIMSTSPLCVVILSPIFGYYLPQMGVKSTLLSGILLVGGTCVLLGSLQWVTGTIFIILCFLLEFVGGIGNAMFQTSIYAHVSTLFPGHYGLVMGLMEVAAGLGYAAGPPIGGALYQLGGFSFPFFVVGSIPLSILPILCILIKSTDCEEEQISPKVIKKVLGNFVVVCLVFSTVIGLSSITLLMPIFSLFLYSEYNLSVYQIGLVNLLDSSSYVLLCLLTGPLYDRLPPRPFIITGLLLCSIACFFIGPAPYIGTPRLWLTLVADGILGVGVALTIAPIYPAMMQVARPQCPDLSTESITMFISGLIPSALSCGELVGPILGGALNGMLGFQKSTALFGEVTLAMAALMLVVTVADHRHNMHPTTYAVADHRHNMHVTIYDAIS